MIASSSGAAFVPNDPLHRRFIVRCGGLDGERMRTTREESLSKDRVFDQGQDVGRVAPRVCAEREARPIPEYAHAARRYSRWQSGSRAARLPAMALRTAS